eukprot:TRINITY_DN24440_c0_g1_i1.p1 TRINITY_DN24440_c0_g1~~TRINITY_DN24440_c0_g1_i1.p1  ORF type:complete len:226 (+),score=45.74 TRINITY_DN24440_c0_g1_i1:2-679(+)
MQWLSLGLCLVGCLAELDVCKTTDFHHGNIRCKCTCPVETTPLKAGFPSESGCDATSQNFDAGVNKDRCGKEMCLTCVNDEQTKQERQCTYSIVTNSEDHCLCQNVMPATAGPNYTDATAADCDLCTCTYEARNTDLIKAAVIIFLVVASTLLAVALVNAVLPYTSATLSVTANEGLDLGASTDDDEAYLLETSANSTTSRKSDSSKRSLTTRLRRNPFENEIGW